MNNEADQTKPAEFMQVDDAAPTPMTILESDATPAPRLELVPNGATSGTIGEAMSPPGHSHVELHRWGHFAFGCTHAVRCMMCMLDGPNQLVEALVEGATAVMYFTFGRAAGRG